MITHSLRHQTNKLRVLHSVTQNSSVGNSDVGGGSKRNARISGSIVFMLYEKTLLVARVIFIAMKSCILREQ